jgi:hypothetical protein
VAVPKKGWRPLVVHQQRYLWRATGTDCGIRVVVVTEAALTRGATAQQLIFNLDYDHLRSALPGGASSLRQRAAVAPGVVALAIQHAVASNPPFTGAIGAQNITLSPQIIGRLQETARIELTDTPVDPAAGEVAQIDEASLIHRIYAAFSAAPRPARDEIAPHRCWECDQVRDRLARHESRGVPISEMEWLADSLPLLSPTALRYYLPRYLELSMTHRSSVVCELVLYHLADEHPNEDYWRERYAVFSAAERHVILEYLRYRSTWPDSAWEREWIERGVKFWSPEEPYRRRAERADGAVSRQEEADSVSGTENDP